MYNNQNFTYLNYFDWNLNESNVSEKKLKFFSKNFDFLVSSSRIEKTIKFSFKFAKQIIKSNISNLNKIHNLKLNTKTYEFLFLPWCYEVISHSYILWQIVTIYKSRNLKINKINLSTILSSQANFKSSSLMTNYWLLYKILNYKNIKYKKLKEIDYEPRRIFPRENFKSKIKSLFNFLRFVFKPRLVISDIGIPLFQEFLFNIKLGQVPIIFETSNIKLKKYDIKLRDKLSNYKKIKGKKNFVNFFKEIFPYIIPIEFLESFKELYNYSKDKKSAGNQQYKILTQNIYPNIRRAIMAKYIQNKSKLYILQHGGGYGTAKLNHGEIIEEYLADQFLSWGWLQKGKKVKKFFNVQSIRYRKIKKKKSNKIVIFFNTETNFFNKAGYWPIFNFQRISKNYAVKKIIKNLDHDKKNILTLRYHERGFRRSGININKKFFGKYLNYDNAVYHWSESISQNDLTIHENINGTSWLDTFSKGVPTLILVDERIYKIRREFKKYYEKLKEKNIIFTDPKKLANFINDNFKNINHYWTSRAIDSLRKKIVKQYCNKEDKPFEKLKRLLKDD